MSARPALPFERFATYLADGLDLDPDALAPDARFDDDLGLDSFDMVELLVRVEELGVHLPEEVVMQVQTVGDLHRHYLRAGAPPDEGRGS